MPLAWAISRASVGHMPSSSRRARDRIQDSLARPRVSDASAISAPPIHADISNCHTVIRRTAPGLSVRDNALRAWHTIASTPS